MLERTGFDLSEWESGKKCSNSMKFDLSDFDFSAVKLVIQRAALVGKLKYKKDKKNRTNKKPLPDGKFDLIFFFFFFFHLSVFDCYFGTKS